MQWYSRLQGSTFCLEHTLTLARTLANQAPRRLLQLRLPDSPFPLPRCATALHIDTLLER